MSEGAKAKVESWHAQLAQLHEDVTRLEQVDACFAALFQWLGELQAPFSKGFVPTLWAHLLAIGVRRAFNKVASLALL